MGNFKVQGWLHLRDATKDNLDVADKEILIIACIQDTLQPGRSITIIELMGLLTPLR